MIGLRYEHLDEIQRLLDHFEGEFPESDWTWRAYDFDGYYSVVFYENGELSESYDLSD